MTPSVRQRLTAWCGLALLAGMSMFAAGMGTVLRHRLMAGVDARLAQRVRGLETALGTEAEIQDREQLAQELDEFVRQTPDGTLVELRSRGGESLRPSAGQAALPETGGSGNARTDWVGGRRVRVAGAELRSAGELWEVRVAVPLDELLGVMEEFEALVLWMMPAVLLMAGAGGYWLSRTALGPVDAITATAREIGVGNLRERVAVPRTGDELERLARTWNEFLERLDGAVGRIRQFTSDASHELRTPLALIRATAELALRKERDAEGYRAALGQIQREAERMTELTEALLTLARSDSGGLELSLAPMDLNDAVEAVVRDHGPLAAEKGIELRAVTAGGGAQVTADTLGIRRVLLILVDNALKHTPAGGMVTVSAEALEGGAVLAVTDTGEGIAAETLPHVFERFYRADAARSGDLGFGLGLSIAQAIAAAHGSRIEASSVTGQGARFSLFVRR